MRRVITGAVAVFLFAVVAAPSAVVAQNEAMQTEEAVTSQTDPAADRQARVEQYRQQATDRLSIADEIRIASICVASQAKVSAQLAKISGVTVSRKSIYNSITTKLDDITLKLQATSVGVARLQATTSQLATHVEAATTALDTYQTALSDAAAMNCESDPDGFQAAVSMARRYRTDAASQAQTVKSYVTDTIKPALTTIRQQIADDASQTEGA